MLTWPTKDPDETVDYVIDWTARLAGDTIAASVFVLLTPAGTVKTQDLFTDTTSTVWLSGGTDGQSAVLVCTVTTAGGRILEETVSLGIVSSTSTVPATGYTPPTAYDLKARFPVFSCVDAAILTRALTEAARRVDETWMEGDFGMGRMLYAAHVLTLDGIGTSSEAKAVANGTAGFKTIKSGSLTLERASDASASSDLNATSYGRRFLDLARINVGGPRVATGAARCHSYDASDWPVDWNGGPN